LPLDFAGPNDTDGNADNDDDDDDTDVDGFCATRPLTSCQQYGHAHRAATRAWPRPPTVLPKALPAVLPEALPQNRSASACGKLVEPKAKSQKERG